MRELTLAWTAAGPRGRQRRPICHDGMCQAGGVLRPRSDAQRATVQFMIRLSGRDAVFAFALGQGGKATLDRGRDSMSARSSSNARFALMFCIPQVPVARAY